MVLNLFSAVKRGARVLVTGGTGFVGVNLVRALVAEGAVVHLLARPTSARSRLDDMETLVRWHAADLTAPEAVREAIRMASPEVVFHLASSSFNPPTTDPARHAQINVMGTLHLLDAVRSGAPEARVVVAGSAAEYGGGVGLVEGQPLRPKTVLGATKAAATLLAQTFARLYGMQVIVARLFTPFGAYERPERLIPSTILSALRGDAIRLTDGRQQRDFLYIDDVVDALCRAAWGSLEPGEVLNICSGQGISVRDMVERILETMDCEVPVVVGALPTRPDEIWELSGSPERARRLLAWEPRVPLREGLSRTIAWWSARVKLKEPQLI